MSLYLIEINMKIIDVLKKLNLIRFGTVKGTYKTGAERPTELMMDDVMNAKTDLVTKNTIKRVFSIFIAIIFLIFAIFFIFGFISGLVGSTKIDTTQPSEQDKTTKLLDTLAKANSVTDFEIKDEDILWTAKNINLQRTNTKSLYLSEIDKTITQNYFFENGWTTDVIGFSYVEKNNEDGIGYLAPMNDEYEYNAGMCIVYYGQSKISCGFGPGGE